MKERQKIISQTELARMIGTQRSNICRPESGAQNPTLDMILKVAYALGRELSGRASGSDRAAAGKKSA